MLTTDILATVTKAGKVSNPEGAPNDFFEMVPVLIPSTTPSMKSCRCIKISYQVKVSFICGVFFNQFSVFILWDLKACKGKTIARIQKKDQKTDEWDLDKS